MRKGDVDLNPLVVVVVLVLVLAAAAVALYLLLFAKEGGGAAVEQYTSCEFAGGLVGVEGICVSNVETCSNDPGEDLTVPRDGHYYQAVKGAAHLCAGGDTCCIKVKLAGSDDVPAGELLQCSNGHPCNGAAYSGGKWVSNLQPDGKCYECLPPGQVVGCLKRDETACT